MTASTRPCPECGKATVGGGGCSYCLLRLGLEASSTALGTRASRISTDGGLTTLSGERFRCMGVLPRFGDYELESEIARGGMGVVYRARQCSLNRVVAIKMIIAGQLATPELVQRFRMEAEAAAQLRHPGIVQIYEVGEYETQHFFSMEYIEGVSLAECLEDFRIQEDAAPSERRQQEVCVAELVARVARALDYAHQRGVLHRDLKPSNILIDELAQPHLTDFGLAKLTDREPSGLTLSNAVIGTPGYLAPEQAAGHADQVTTAADVYGLGATMYQLLTGRPPFAGATAVETMWMAVHQDPLPPRAHNSTLDRDLETIALRCLEKSPERRYRSAAAVADELERFVRREPILARPVSRAEHVRRWCQRNPLVAGSLAALAAVFVSAFAAVSWSYLRAEVAFKEEARLRQEAQGREKAERWERYRSNLVAGASALRLYNVTAARDALEAAPPEHRNWEWRHLHHQLDTAQRVLHFPAGAQAIRFSADRSRVALLYPVSKPYLLDLKAPNPTASELAIGSWFTDLSSNGKLIASGAMGYAIAIESLLGDRPRVGIHGPADMHDFPQFSPDGTRLAAGFTDDTVRVWDTATGKELLVLRGHKADPARLAFSPDGRQLASTGSEDRTVRLWDTHDGRALAVLGGHEASVGRVLFSPQGDRVLSAESYPNNVMRLWDVATGELRTLLRGHGNQIQDMAFSPDGAHIASGAFDQTVRLWDGATGRPVATLSGHRGRINSVAFSPDSRRLISSAQDQTVRLWDATDGAPLAVLLGHTSAVLGAAYTPDGASIVSGSTSGDLRVWDAPLTERNGILRGHKDAVYGVAFHPDGVRIASADWDGTTRLWDINTGQTLAVLRHGVETPPTPVTAVAFHPAGKLLATLARDDAVRLWNVETGTEVHRFNVPSKWFMDSRLSFSPRGDLLATGGRDRMVYIWNVSDQSEVARLKGHTDFVRDVVFSRDGSWLASAGELSDKTIRIWDVATKKQLHVLEGHTSGVYALAVSPDGKLLASGATDGTARLWDTATWRETAVLTHGSGVYGLAFTPDGSRLTCGCADNTIRLWDAATHQAVCDLQGHTDYVHQVAFSPDGTRLISGSGDSTVRVWDSLSRQQRAAGVLANPTP